MKPYSDNIVITTKGTAFILLYIFPNLSTKKIGHLNFKT